MGFYSKEKNRQKYQSKNKKCVGICWFHISETLTAQHGFCKKLLTCDKRICNVMSGIRSHLAFCQYGGELGSYKKKIAQVHVSTP